MNIFYLDNDVKVCAQYHCDKHVVKMILEYAQLLSTAHRVLDGKEYIDSSSGRKIKRWELNDSRESLLYKATHINHPSAVWVRQSKANYDWLYQLWIETLAEYRYRYTKSHACEKLIHSLKRHPDKIVDKEFFEPPLAMPELYKVNGNAVTSYRNYYRGDKLKIAKWKIRSAPVWFTPLNGVDNNANLHVSK